MSDLIKRSDAIEALKDSVVEMGGDDFCEMGVHIDDIEAVVNAIPSADRPQGEWIDIGTISHSYKCSVCGRTLFHITVGKNHVAKYYPYCHCGARMKGADDE